MPLPRRFKPNQTPNGWQLARRIEDINHAEWRPTNRNRLLNPCKSCGAKRYERCVEWRALRDENGQGRATGYYPVTKDNPCSTRRYGQLPE